MGRVTDNFIKHIESYGFKARIVSIEHIKEIQSDMENTRRIHRDIDNYIGKYIDKFNYGIWENSLKAKSIIIIAVPQPIVRIHFTFGMKRCAVIMPPMYLLNTSNELEKKQKKIIEVTSIIEKILSDENFKAIKTNLLCKLLAARSGLGAYGRNNICYIDNESSFYWIGVYMSDMPCKDDPWQKNSIMNACRNCSLCLKNCPRGAIADDRFIIHANKCITLYNECEGDFPKWMDSNCHNSIIGCMKCQIICPINKNYIRNIEDLAEFDDDETKMILAKTPLDQLSEITYKKLKSINFIEDYSLLARNLKALTSSRLL